MYDIAMFFLPAFVACLVLLGIHVYLGIHVITRGVIFVDLALAQIAALGAMCGLFVGAEPGSTESYFVSLGFTFVGAILFTLARSQAKRVPVEAFIGIVYAVASAVAIIVANKGPHGADEIQQIMVGSLLVVTPERIAVTAGVYVVIAAIHYAFREKFLRLSFDPEGAERSGMSIAWWDLAFYATFGVVISLSVTIGGVLLVFTFLVGPTVIVALFTQGVGRRLLAGWGVGLVGSVLGLAASYEFDAPTGAAVVATFGSLLAVALVARVLIPGEIQTDLSSGSHH